MLSLFSVSSPAPVNRRRTPREPRSPFRRLFLCLAIFVGLSGVFFAGGGFLFRRFYLCNESLFSIRDLEDVRVEGCTSISPDRILDFVEIKKGTKLFDFPTEKARQRILTHVPNIKSVSLQLYLPNRILIRLIERDPVACLRRSNLVVDEEGMVFVRNDVLSLALPVIAGLDASTPVEPGQRVAGYYTAAIRLAMAVTRNAYSFRVRQIDVSKQDYLVLTMEDQRQARVAWRGMEDPYKETAVWMTKQLEILSQAMAAPYSRNRLLFNATVPGRVSAAE